MSGPRGKCNGGRLHDHHGMPVKRSDEQGVAGTDSGHDIEPMPQPCPATDVITPNRSEYGLTHPDAYPTLPFVVKSGYMLRPFHRLRPTSTWSFASARPQGDRTTGLHSMSRGLLPINSPDKLSADCTPVNWQVRPDRSDSRTGISGRGRSHGFTSKTPNYSGTRGAEERREDPHEPTRRL